MGQRDGCDWSQVQQAGLDQWGMAANDQLFNSQASVQRVAGSNAFEPYYMGRRPTRNAEGIYGESELSRCCWAEVLAEKLDRGELSESDALRTGRQIQRDNALELYPRLKGKLQTEEPDQVHGQ